MKNVRTIAIAALTALLPLSGALAQSELPKTYKDINAPKLREVKMPQPKRIELANGMIIFLMEDHELPLIRGTARIRGGARDIDAAKTGLAGIMGAAWRTGGTESKTGDQLDDFLEARAARVETGVADDSSTVRMDILKDDLNAVFPLFVDVLTKPAFRQEKIDLAKTQASSAISRRNDDAQGIGNREAAKLAYGPNSPYARVSEYSTINAITRDDLVNFHKRFVHPNNVMLGFVGDFDSAAMEKTLRATFEPWQRGPEASKVAPSDVTSAKTGVYFVPKEDVTQSNIYLVTGGGILRSNPDYYAVQVMNEILSGSFSGRLMNKIRTEMGLAYGVGGGIGTEWDRPGLFRIWMGTKSESTAQAIGALRGEVAALHNKPFSAAELSLAKESLLNSYIFTMDSKAKILAQQVNLAFYGYPTDWYGQYISNIQNVTAEDVARVAKKYVAPDKLSVLVVGNDKDFGTPLSSLGSVSKIDIAIPEPGAAPAGAKPAASNAEGTALINKVASFVGGQAIGNVKAIHRKGTAKQGQMDIEFDEVQVLPDMSRRILKSPMGEMTMVVTPTSAFVSGPMGLQDLPASQRASMESDSRGDLLTVLRNISNPAYTFTVTGTEQVGGVNAQVLQVNANGSNFKWYVDPATGRLLRKVATGRMGEQVTDYADWKTVGGIQLPTTATITSGGQPMGGMTLTSFEINPTVDPKIFEKPPAK